MSAPVARAASRLLFVRSGAALLGSSPVRAAVGASCTIRLRSLSSASATEIPIPELGAESIVEGGILTLAKGVGDYVAAEEMVAEIETDKVTIEAKSPHGGTITAIHVEVGQTVEVGGKFFSMAIGEGEAGAAAAAPTSAPATKQPVVLVAPAHASAEFAAARIHPSGKPSLMLFPPRGAAALAAASAAKAAAPVMQAAPAAAVKAPAAAKTPALSLAQSDLPLRFRRPLISEEEMEAIMSGGADNVWAEAGCK